MPRDREAVRPQDPQLRGQYQVFRRQDYVRTYARTCTQWVYFNIIMYYTLQRERSSTWRQGWEQLNTGWRRWEENYTYQPGTCTIVLAYWMYLQSVTLSPSIQNGEAQSNVLQRQYLKNHIGLRLEHLPDRTQKQIISWFSIQGFS